jgi:hypothetical protein
LTALGTDRKVPGSRGVFPRGEALLARQRQADSEAHGEEPADPVLRAKYLDYCSARVADLLLRLTADEMYVLAQDAARELEGERGEPLSYTEIVRLATDRISKKLALPDFQRWVVEYLADPESFEKELLGLWETDFGATERELP